MISSLEPGIYALEAWPDAQHTRSGLVSSVQVVAGQTTTQNLVVGNLQPIPPGSSVDTPDGTVTSGLPTVMPTGAPITLHTTACAAGTVSYGFESGATESGPMYRGTISGTQQSIQACTTSFPTGMGTVTITISGCPNNDPITFNIEYIDPSGTVMTARDSLPILGATVPCCDRRARRPARSRRCRTAATSMSPGNRTNPDTTLANGLFAWDVVAGFYIVSKAVREAGARQRAGRVPGGEDSITQAGRDLPSESPATTPVLTIPPPALDLKLRLDCGGPRAHASKASLDFAETATGATSPEAVRSRSTTLAPSGCTSTCRSRHPRAMRATWPSRATAPRGDRSRPPLHGDCDVRPASAGRPCARLEAQARGRRRPAGRGRDAHRQHAGAGDATTAAARSTRAAAATTASAAAAAGPTIRQAALRGAPSSRRPHPCRARASCGFAVAWRSSARRGSAASPWAARRHLAAVALGAERDREARASRRHRDAAALAVGTQAAAPGRCEGRTCSRPRAGARRRPQTGRGGHEAHAHPPRSSDAEVVTRRAGAPRSSRGSRAARRRAAGDRQLGVRQRLEVGDVLAEDRRGAHAVEHLAVPRHDVLGLLDERLEAPQRREVGVARAAFGDPRDLDRREVVAADERPAPRRSTRPCRRPCGRRRGAARAPRRRSRSGRGPAALAPGRATAARGATYHSSSNARSSRAAAPGSAARRAAVVSATPSAACGKASRPSR